MQVAGTGTCQVGQESSNGLVVLLFRFFFLSAATAGLGRHRQSAVLALVDLECFHLFDGERQAAGVAHDTVDVLHERQSVCHVVLSR